MHTVKLARYNGDAHTTSVAHNRLSTVRYRTSISLLCEPPSWTKRNLSLALVRHSDERRNAMSYHVLSDKSTLKSPLNVPTPFAASRLLKLSVSQFRRGWQH